MFSFFLPKITVSLVGKGYYNSLVPWAVCADIPMEEVSWLGEGNEQFYLCSESKDGGAR